MKEIRKPFDFMKIMLTHTQQTLFYIHWPRIKTFGNYAKQNSYLISSVRYKWVRTICTARWIALSVDCDCFSSVMIWFNPSGCGSHVILSLGSSFGVCCYICCVSLPLLLLLKSRYIFVWRTNRQKNEEKEGKSCVDGFYCCRHYRKELQLPQKARILLIFSNSLSPGRVTPYSRTMLALNPSDAKLVFALIVVLFRKGRVCFLIFLSTQLTTAERIQFARGVALPVACSRGEKGCEFID